MLKKFLDVRHPIFLPLWRRVLAVALPLLWGLVEVANGAPAWATLFILAGLYLGWAFFVNWDEEAVREMERERD